MTLETATRVESAKPFLTASAALSPQGLLWLRLFLGFLALAAGIAVLALLAGHFGDLELRVIATTVMVSLTSLCALSCAEYGRRSSNRIASIGGMVLAFSACAVMLPCIWVGAIANDVWKLAVVLSIAAAAVAHFFGLCLFRLKGGHEWLLITAAVTIFLLATLLSLVTLNGFDGGEVTFKWIGVLAVTDLAVTIAVPILSRIHRAEDLQQEILAINEASERFTVTRLNDGRYRLDDGTLLVVQQQDSV